jgi:hypothetical protein
VPYHFQLPAASLTNISLPPPTTATFQYPLPLCHLQVPITTLCRHLTDTMPWLQPHSCLVATPSPLPLVARTSALLCSSFAPEIQLPKLWPLFFFNFEMANFEHYPLATTTFSLYSPACTTTSPPEYHGPPPPPITTAMGHHEPTANHHSSALPKPKPRSLPRMLLLFLALLLLRCHAIHTFQTDRPACR